MTLPIVPASTGIELTDLAKALDPTGFLSYKDSDAWLVALSLGFMLALVSLCLLYTSDAADE